MAPAFLGVSASLTGRRWVGPSVEDTRHAEALEQVTRLPAAVCRVLSRRGIAAHDAEGFMAPSLRELLPDPRGLLDMEQAATRFLAAVAKRERIAVFADYDVDGGTSAALLIDWLRHKNQTCTLYVPDRIEEGYGPNPTAIEQLGRAHDLIICVDCGTLSHEALAA
ncbi:MAG: single-stranded-DNA-specific exonuclease, partial [Paracoccaceae bacterium]